MVCVLLQKHPAAVCPGKTEPFDLRAAQLLDVAPLNVSERE